MDGLGSIGKVSPPAALHGPPGGTANPPRQQGEKLGPDGLTDSEREQVRALKQRDQEVRAHERAHQAAAGPYAGGASFTFVRGPDGRQYAVGGEVKIDASPVSGNPEATIGKMEAVVRAALAPAQPSAQDQRVAAQAQATKAKALIELQQKRQDEAEAHGEGDDTATVPAARVAGDAYAAVADALTRGAGGTFNLVA